MPDSCMQMAARRMLCSHAALHALRRAGLMAAGHAATRHACRDCISTVAVAAGPPSSACPSPPACFARCPCAMCFDAARACMLAWLCRGQLAKGVARKKACAKTASKLVKEALAAGTQDNVTVIVVDARM